MADKPTLPQQVDLLWAAGEAPDVIEVTIRPAAPTTLPAQLPPGPDTPSILPVPAASRLLAVRRLPPLPFTRPKTGTAGFSTGRPHWQPLALGILYGCSALALMVILGVVLWQGTGAGPTTSAQQMLPLLPSRSAESAVTGSTTSPVPTVTVTAPAAKGQATAPGSNDLPGQPPNGASSGPESGAAAHPSNLGPAPAPTSGPGQSPAPSTTGSPAPSAPSPSTGPSDSGTLSAGATGKPVKVLQRLLRQQGFTYVTVTGTYDEATVRGVTQLQQDRGLTCDPAGVYGPCTRASLAGS